eukprot:8789875-Alexandrium_andersonii.AAC.1
MSLFWLADLGCLALSVYWLPALFPARLDCLAFQTRCCDARCRLLCPAAPACGSAVSGGCGAVAV